MVRKPTASAGIVAVTALRSATSDSRKAARSEVASRLLRAAERLRRMNYTIDITTRHHMMVAEASVCLSSAPSRHRERFRYSERPVITSAEVLRQLRISATVSSFSTLSTNGRLPYHHVVTGDDTHGQIHEVRPNRARKTEYSRSGTTLCAG